MVKDEPLWVPTLKKRFLPKIRSNFPSILTREKFSFIFSFYIFTVNNNDEAFFISFPTSKL